MRIWLAGLTVSAVLLVPVAPASAQVVHAPWADGVTNATSKNWAGYAVTGGPFRNVSASWAQPAVRCAAGETSYSSFWVGLDGYTNRTVEQIGTDADCVNGAPRYYAWAELYPKMSAQLVNVSPGDTISATVTTDGSGNFTLTIAVDNETPITVTGRMRRASLASAEVIAEAPSSNHGPNGMLALANFGTVPFTGATVDGTSLGLQNPDEITMTQSGTTLAQPTAISNTGDFSIHWETAAGPPTGHPHGHP